jgi:hypothetical protein
MGQSRLGGASGRPSHVRKALLATVGPKTAGCRDGPKPASCIAAKSGWFRTAWSAVQLIEQGLGLLQVERVEAFSEPAVDRSEKLAGLLELALIAPEPRHAHRGA